MCICRLKVLFVHQGIPVGQRPIFGLRQGAEAFQHLLKLSAGKAPIVSNVLDGYALARLLCMPSGGLGKESDRGHLSVYHLHNKLHSKGPTCFPSMKEIIQLRDDQMVDINASAIQAWE